MRPTNAPSCVWRLSLLVLALLPPSTASAKRSANRTRRRRGGLGPAPTSKLLESNSEETLRERWVDILSREGDSDDIVRPDSRRERHYYYEAELLADKLLGTGENDCGGSLLRSQNDPPEGNSLLSEELSILWKAMAIASSVMLIGIPITSLFNTIVTSNAIQTLFASVQSSITPYLLPTLSILSDSLRNYLLQAQAIAHSAPYLLRHLHHIKLRPLPFLYKLARKCIILEAWRHVWVRVYKVTRYLWKGTLAHARAGYLRLTPAWIRRGVESYFKSMVQAQVHGVVGGAMGALGGVTFESWAWWGGSEGTTGVSSDEGPHQDAAAEAATETAAQGLENAVHDIVDSVVSEGDAMADILSDGVASAAESAVDSIVEETMDVMAENLDSSVDFAVESFVDECLTEGCVDQVMEAVLE